MNLLPGQGLGFGGSKELAFGLAAFTSTFVPIPPVIEEGGGGGGSRSALVLDNAYSRRSDDHEIIELLTILFRVIE
jgi:hypothetical protein